jgi:biotin operon repressor
VSDSNKESGNQKTIGKHIRRLRHMGINIKEFDLQKHGKAM